MPQLGELLEQLAQLAREEQERRELARAWKVKRDKWEHEQSDDNLGDDVVDTVAARSRAGADAAAAAARQGPAAAPVAGAMTAAGGDDPRSTVHFRLGRIVARRIVDDTPSQPELGDSWLAVAATDNDPEMRRRYAIQVNAAWGLTAFACVFGMVAIALPVKLLVSEAAGDILFAALMFCGVFCVAGCAYVLWRSYAFMPKARRLASQGKQDTAEFAQALRAVMPRDGSLIFQTAVGLAAAFFAVR